MTANIMEGIDLSFTVLDREDVVPGKSELDILSRLRESLSSVKGQVERGEL